MFEVLNGIMKRSDAKEFIEKIKFGLIPGGTSNATFKNICEDSKETYSPEAAAYLICKGQSRGMDVTEVEGEFFEEKIYSILFSSWAIFADVDISSEVIRFAGSLRYTIFAVLKII